MKKAAVTRKPPKRIFLLLAALLAVGLAGDAAAENQVPTEIAERIRPTEDFSKPEPGEPFPGGAATSRKSTDNRNAFSHSPGNLGFRAELDFKLGNAIFRKVWVSAPASTRASDGLGPLRL